jgi:hypothetical protein
VHVVEPAVEPAALPKVAVPGVESEVASSMKPDCGTSDGPAHERGRVRQGAALPGIGAGMWAADGVDRVAAFAYCRTDVLDNTSWKRGPVNARRQAEHPGDLGR